MSGLLAVQELIKQERQKQEQDLLNLTNIVSKLEKIDQKIDERFEEINPKSRYRLLSIRDVMDLVGFGDKWISEKVSEGSFPEPKIIGGKRKWYQKDVEKWIKLNMETTEH